MTLKFLAMAALVLGGFAIAHAQDDDIVQLPGPPGQRPPNPRGDRGPREERGVFLSPAGEPFRVPPGQPYPSALWFAQADADHDGKITRAELEADFARFFVTLDENHDGVVDGFEAEDYEHNIAPEILSVYERPAGGPNEGPAGGPNGGPNGDQGSGGRRRGGGGGGPPGGQSKADKAAAQANMRLQLQGAAAYSFLAISEPVSGADADIDGKITLTEFKAAADRRFDLLDKKKLGYLTLVELPRPPAQIAAEGKKPKPGGAGSGAEGAPPQGAKAP